MENTFKIPVKLEITVTMQDIDDIIATALEGGINYWCKKVEVVGDYLGQYASDQISRKGSLKVYDMEGDDVYTLTFLNFIKGLEKYIANGNRPYNIVNPDGTLDTCMVDATVADMIIQYALFDQIVYG